MFSSSPNYTKLKTHLRLAINRLKLIEKKKIELTQKSRKEIADYIGAGKSERAKIRVEHIIREDYMVEAMEIVEMYCDLLLARFGLITQMKELDEGLAEAISSLIWVSPRMQTDIQELKIISDLLTSKYGKPYADACRSENLATISDKLKHKMSVQSPPKILVEKYLIEIAKNYNVEYEPDPQIMREDNGSDALLIDINNGQPGPPGFIGGYSMPMPQMSQMPQMPQMLQYPQYPPMPNNSNAPFNYPTKPSGGNAGGFYIAPQSQQPQPPMTYNIPPGADSKDINSSFLQDEMNNLPPAYDSLSPDDNLMKSNNSKPQPRAKFGADCSNVTAVTFPDLPDIPDLPSVPSDDLFPPHATNSGRDLPMPPKDDIDFDDLTRRFEELKKKK